MTLYARVHGTHLRYLNSTTNRTLEKRPNRPKRPKRPREEGGESGAHVAPLQTDFVTAGDLIAAASASSLDQALEMPAVNLPQSVGSQHNVAQLEAVENDGVVGHDDSGDERDAESEEESGLDGAALFSTTTRNTIIPASGADLEDAPRAMTAGEKEVSHDVIPYSYALPLRKRRRCWWQTRRMGESHVARARTESLTAHGRF